MSATDGTIPRCGCGAFLAEVPDGEHLDCFRYVCHNPKHKRTGADS